MTPGNHQLLVDQLDKHLTNSDVPSTAGPLNGDAETAKEWRILNMAVEAIRYNALSREVRMVREHFAGIHAKQETGIVRQMLPRVMQIAAAVLVLLSVVSLGKYVLTTPSGIYDKYYTSYDLGATRGVGVTDPLEMAYQAKNWSAVEHSFDVSTGKSGKDYFLAGMANMEQKKYTQAIVLFKTLMGNNVGAKVPYFEDEAEYYLALSYMATGQTSAALLLLERIKADPNHLFNKQVRNMSGVDMLILHAK